MAIQALTVEARLLAQPVSFELASSTQAEGLEDRATMAPLAARRLGEMVSLGERIGAVELVVAARAVALRDAGPLGAGTGAAYELVRGLFPRAVEEGGPPPGLDPLVERIRAGALRAQSCSA